MATLKGSTAAADKSECGVNFNNLLNHKCKYKCLLLFSFTHKTVLNFVSTHTQLEVIVNW